MKRLVNIPESRTAPKEVIQRLREIDPAAELVYMGGGRWRLGRVVPSRDRTRKGTLLLMWESRMPAEKQDGTNLRIGRLAQQGFGSIAEYQVQGEPGAQIVEDFRLRDFNFRTNSEATFQARLAESAGDTAAIEKENRIMDWLDVQAPDVWRHAFKHPVYSLPSAN